MISLVSMFVILLVIAVSLLIGWNARNWLGKPSPLEQSLRLELADLKKELQDYEQEVNLHFKKSAELFNNLLKQSKNLYEHLLAGSKNLCRSESEADAIMNFLSEGKDNENNWQEIILKAPSSPINNVTNATTSTLDEKLENKSTRSVINTPINTSDDNWSRPSYLELEEESKEKY